MNKQNKERWIKLQLDAAIAKAGPTRPAHMNNPNYFGIVNKHGGLIVNDNTTNGLTRCIRTFLQLSGHQAERISTTGRYLADKATINYFTGKVSGGGRYIPTTGTKGSADLSVILAPGGRSLKIEVKFGKDRQSDDQRKYEAKVNSAGGIYYIARTFDDFLEFYDNLIEKGYNL